MKIYEIFSCSELVLGRVKATCNETPVNIYRLGKLKPTRYLAYNSDMGIFDLKIDKFNDFCDFLMKKLDFEAFLSKYRDLCYGN